MSDSFRILEDGDVFLEDVDCMLKCNFCIHGIKKRARGRGVLRRALARATNSRNKILEEFERKITGLPAGKGNRVCLSGWDVLECEGIFDLLDVCKRHEKNIEIISPGLRLADRDFATRISKYEPRITVTYLTHRAETYSEMTGNPAAKRLVERAIDNLAELGVEFSANFVATGENYSDLLQVASFLLDDVGMEMFTLMFFSPDKWHQEEDPKIGDLFVEYRLLGEELANFARRYAGKEKLLCLWRVPPCKLDAETLTCGNVFFSVNGFIDPAYPVYRHPGCDSCNWNPKCYFVSRYYRDQYPDEDFEWEKVNRVLDKIRH